MVQVKAPHPAQWPHSQGADWGVSAKVPHHAPAVLGQQNVNGRTYCVVHVGVVAACSTMKLAAQGPAAPIELLDSPTQCRFV